ncbi:MAG: hypothetical protein KBD16_02380 [Candidatus Pacebacteria bacterium]|nr:hypothetical protein [Candidatus Paceibacterota bacterium]
MTDSPQNQYELVIEFIFKSSNKFGFGKGKFPVQNRPFKIGLRIENTGKKHFPGGKVKDLSIKPGQTAARFITHKISEEYGIPELNPKETKESWLLDFCTTLEGQVWLECTLNANDGGGVVTHQREQHTGNIIENFQNGWGVDVYIESERKKQNDRSNLLLLVLAILTFLDALFGLKNVMKVTLKFFGEVFIGLGNSILSIIGN